MENEGSYAALGLKVWKAQIEVETPRACFVVKIKLTALNYFPKPAEPVEAALKAQLRRSLLCRQ
jgi:hypothetical protein